MIDRTHRIPMYLQIKEEILEMVEGMGFDQQLPSELALANQYQVSRGTVKQAIMELVNEEKLYRIQGKGTFVAPPKITRTFTQLPSFTNDIRRLGYTPESEIIQFEQITVPAHVKNKLQLNENVKTVCFKRVVRASGKPVAFVTSYLNATHYPGLTKTEIGHSLYDTLDRLYGKKPVRVDDTYTPRNADGKIAELLQIKPGDAIFYSERVAYLRDKVPVEYVESYIRSDQFTLNVHLSQPDSKDESGYFGFHFENPDSEQ